MLKIKPSNQIHLTTIFQLSVAQAQRPFIGTVEEILDSKTKGCDLHVLTANDEIVGLFIADTRYDEKYEFASKFEIGLRSFFIDQHHQGKGYGKAFAQMLGGYIKVCYPKYTAIILTVNCKNPAAYYCYKQAGFIDSNELYHGGMAGPQNIMRMNLLATLKS